MTVAKAFGSAFAIRKHETLHDSRGMTVEKTVEALNAAHLVLLLALQLEKPVKRRCL